MAKEAFDDIARKKSHARATGAKYFDPNAQEGGFKRDTWAEGKGEALAQEARQRDYLNDADGGGGAQGGGVDSRRINTPQEMPKDLLNFLESAGPLERTVDKSRTSPKVYESLLEVEEEERQKKQANQRTRRRMLMVEQQQQQHDMSNGGGEVLRGGGDDLDLESEHMKAGMTTTRTTSFSTTVPKEADKAELKFTDIDLFRFLSQVREKELSPEEYLQRTFTTGKDDKEDGKKKGGASDPVLPLITEEEMQRNLIWLQDLCKYNGVPVLLQDTDESLVGSWTHNVEDLKRQKIHLAKNGATLAIQNEVEKLLANGAKKNIPDIK